MDNSNSKEEDTRLLINNREDNEPNIASATFNLLNVIVGVGILALPYAFLNVGVVLGIGLLILLAIATLCSYELLLTSSEIAQVFSYAELATVSLGPFAGKVVNIIMMFDTFVSLSAFMVAVADSSEKFFEEFIKNSNSIFLDKRILLALSLIILIPLSLLRKITFLGWTSLASLLPLIYLLILQVIFLWTGGSQPPGTPVPLFKDNVFVALPIIVFAYASQTALFPIYNDLKEQNGGRKEMQSVVYISVGITFFIYSFCAIIGIITFPTSALGNILLNYDNNIWMDILLVSFIISIVLGYPVVLFPCRDAVDRLLFPNSKQNYMRFAVETMFLITITFTIAVLIPSFSTILGLGGSITKTTIDFVLPSLYYLKLSKEPILTDKLKWMSLILLILGTISGIISAIITLMNFFKESK